MNQSLNQSHEGSFDQLSQSILSQASLLNPDLQSLLQQSLSGNNNLQAALNGSGAASLAGLASSLSNLNQIEKTETLESEKQAIETPVESATTSAIGKMNRETPSPSTKYRQGKH